MFCSAVTQVDNTVDLELYQLNIYGSYILR